MIFFLQHINKTREMKESDSFDIQSRGGRDKQRYTPKQNVVRLSARQNVTDNEADYGMCSFRPAKGDHTPVL